MPKFDNNTHQKQETASCLMLQGTGSSVGKTFLVSGLGRLLKNKGIRVAPFKSQNMSLNSAVSTSDTEISRAQAIQAEACGIEPLAELNPILLKPQSDKTAQLILNGEIVGNFSASQYHDMKLSLLPKCAESLDLLRKDFEVVVIEGAGSPAEINLMEEDIANMKIAEAADCPVILIGDIDKGGVFAQLYGTYMLLPEDQRKRVKGFIINKFRGDKKLLDDGITFIEEKTNVPVLGVLPMLDIELEAEDSMSEVPVSQGEIDIAVIKLPRISNLTDFWPLTKENNVGLRYTSNANDIQNADVVIIPGSKSVISDLKWLRQKGYDRALEKACNNKALIVGICGGFQMLGKSIKDDQKIESSSSQVDGLNLLDMQTVFKPAKVTKRTSAVFNANSDFKDLKGIKVSGYEIHNGLSCSSKDSCFISEKQNDCVLGLTNNNVFGTYLHGIFENDDFRKQFLNIVRKKRGYESRASSFNSLEFKEAQFDKLAEAIHKHLDVEAIERLIFSQNCAKKVLEGATV